MAVTTLHATQFSAVPVVTTTETVVGVVGPLPENLGPSAGLGVLVEATLGITTGAAATGVTIRVRQGNGITGTVVSASPVIAVAASTVVGLSWSGLDAAALQPGAVYSVTVQQAAATGNASVSGVATAETVS